MPQTESPASSYDRTTSGHHSSLKGDATDLLCGDTRGALWQHKMSVVARQHEPSIFMHHTRCIMHHVLTTSGFGPWSRLWSLVPGPWVLALVPGPWSLVPWPWSMAMAMASLGPIRCSKLNLHNSTLVAPFGTSIEAK